MFPALSFKGRSGIYQIVNTVNGKIYVGKAKCLWRRCHGYLNAVKKIKRDKINDYFLNSILKHGIDKFVFLPIEFCEIEMLAERELHWIDTLNTTNRSKGYNLRRDSSTGMITHPSTSARISNNLKRQWADGIRSDHGDKLKSAWNQNDDRRMKQSVLMSKIKTKYFYIVNDSESVTYKGLCDLGLGTALSNFHRRKSDSITCKGNKVTRIRQETQT